MRKVQLFVLFTFFSSFVQIGAQLVYDGHEYSSANTGYYGGLSIPRLVPTQFYFTNNLYTTQNASGYQLVAGDEVLGSTNNNLDNAVITGNRFIWNGTDPASETHALFTGYNKNVVIKYNYMYRSPNAIPRKASGMMNTSGGVAYNILVDPTVAVVAKGMSGVRIYNNTFYSTKTQTDTWRGIVDIHKNTDDGQDVVSTDTKVFNNIFYLKQPRICINIYETECLSGFESDYNVYYCENGTPHFQIGQTVYDWPDWRNLGYDAHSVIVNPNFTDFINFIPAARLNYGTDLGSEFQTGLAINATWVTGVAPSTTAQNGTWQAGARIFGAVPVTGITVNGAGGASTISTDNGTLQLTATVLPANASINTVTWTITNGTGQATINSSGLVTAVANGTVTARATAQDGSGVYGTLVITISNQVIPVTSITVTGAGGASSISTDNGTLQLTANVLPANASNNAVTWSITNGTGQATISSSGLVTAAENGTVTARATAQDGTGVYGTLQITISNQITPVTSITVNGAGGASTISTDNGTLQLAATVLPANAVQTVTWSIVNGTGSATISPSGLVTAGSNGTVTARATTTDGSGVYGTLVITISNQTIAVTAITVTGAGGATTITTDNGTLQLTADVSPASASNKSVTWSVTNGTGQATISGSGLLAAVSDGTVTARATANDGTGIYGTLVVTISNQVVPVTGITVTGAGGASIITVNGGTLQLTALVAPANATNKAVTWSLTNGTGQATISSGGLVTAVANGTVTARATANDGSGVSGTLVITIASQVIPVTGITVTGEGGATTITQDDGTLQLTANVLPANATNKSVTWSVGGGIGAASINASGLLTAISNGTVIAMATANDGSGISGSLFVTISNQVVPVSSITITGEGGATAIFTDDGTLQLFASVLPDYANDRSVEWTIENGTGEALIDNSGLVSAISNGTVTAKATAKDGSGIFGTLVLTISGQVIPVETIDIEGEGGLNSINIENGSLQLIATITPGNATDKSVSWSVTSAGTGAATINAVGLVTALESGTVTAHASANDGSGVTGIMNINISFGGGTTFTTIVNTDLIRLVLFEDFTSWFADLYDLRGHHIARKIIDSNEVDFSTRTLTPGLYIIILSKGELLEVAKVVVP